MVSCEFLGHEQLVARNGLVPLAIINHFKPTRPVNVTLDELYPEGIHERDLALAPDPEKIFIAEFFPLARPVAQNLPNGLPNIKSIHSANSR